MDGHLLRFFALLLPFLLFWLAGCRGADAATSTHYLEVVVNLQGASVLDPSRLPSVYANSLSQMDNSDVDVKICPLETFSADHGGVCGPCSVCQVEQYISEQCLPWQNRVCSNCTVCGWHEVELCNCDAVDSKCFTGDRICVKLVPAALNLTVYMRSVKMLTNIQQNFIISGLEIWYVDWLMSTFDIESATFRNFGYRGNYTYAAVFEIFGVYDSGTLSQIQAGIPSQFQQGFLYSFGLHRRRLLFAPLTDVYVNGAGTECSIPTDTCSNITTFMLSDDSCRALCMPAPCPVGFYGVYGKCFPCLEGTYKGNVTDGNCTVCPGNMTSAAGATAVSECFVPTTVAAMPVSTTLLSAYSSTTALTTIQSFAATTRAITTKVAATTSITTSALRTTSAAASSTAASATAIFSSYAVAAATTTFAQPVLTTPRPTEGAYTTTPLTFPTTPQPQVSTVPPPHPLPTTSEVAPSTTPAPSAVSGSSVFDSTIMLVAMWGTLGVTVLALCTFGVCFACLFALVLRRLAPQHASDIGAHFFDTGEVTEEIIGLDEEARPIIRCRLSYG